MPAIAEPPVKPAAEQPKKPAPDQKAARRFAENITGVKSEPAKPKEEKLKEEPAAKPKAEAPKPKAAAPAPTLDRETIASAVAEGMARGSKTPDKVEDAPKADEPEVPASEKRRMAVYERMETLMPDKYPKGFAKKQKEAIVKEAKYADDWLAANPDKDFDAEDDEHKEFYKTNAVDYDDDDFDASKEAILLDNARTQAKAELQPQLTALERSEKLRVETPKIAQAQLKSALGYFGEMEGDFAKILKADGAVDAELYKKLQDKDPIAVQIVVTGANTIEGYVEDIYKLFGNLVEYDGKNTNHATISNFVIAKETQLLQQPKEKQLDDQGRQFLAADKFHALAAKERDKFWTFTREDVETLLTAAVVAQTKEQIKTEEEKFQRVAKARGMTVPELKAEIAEDAPPVEQPAKPAEDEAVDDDEADDKPSSPSAAAQPRVSENGGKPAATNPKSNFRNRLVGD